MRAAVKNINKITVDFHGQHYCKSFEIKKKSIASAVLDDGRASGRTRVIHVVISNGYNG
jgi:hypothetical protein